ncbi:MAG: hypothetical protein JJ848_009480 [Prochlorococcus marinus CUG1439]|nr:hypothetical protein [Prochlorococcus marinus CUG1439]
MYEVKKNFKNTGILHILLGLLIIFLLSFFVETIAGNASNETLLHVRGTADDVAASNLGIGCLLIISSSIKDKASLRKVLFGELVLMSCFLAVALFNSFNAGTICRWWTSFSFLDCFDSQSSFMYLRIK